MNTVFLLIVSLFNKFNFDLKIINSIFKFDLKENKILLKLNTIKELNPSFMNNGKKNSIFSLRKQFDDKKSIDSENKSKNNLIFAKEKEKEKDFNISDLNISNNKLDNNENKISGIKIDKAENYSYIENQNINIYKIKAKSDNKTKNSYNLINKFNLEFRNNKTNSKEDFNEKINLHFFDYFCTKKSSKRYKYILLFNKGNRFYRKKLDIVHVFSVLSFFEEFLKKELLE